MPLSFRALPGAALLGLGTAAILSAALALPPVHERATLRGYPDRAKLYPGAYDALALWGMARAYPAADLPPTGYADAVAHRQAQAARSGGEGAGPWRAMGPLNVGGRALAIAVNPQNPRTLWTGSASGGIWRSTTAGEGAEAWQLVPTGTGATAITAIAIAPQDSSTLYVGTGEVYRYREVNGGVVYRPSRGSYGVGVLKTTDGGATWTKALDWSRHQERGVHMVKLDGAGHVWAATTEGLLVSRDGGATWTTSLDVVMASDVAFVPGQPGVIVAACGNQQSAGYGLYRSTDGGGSWTPISSPAIPDVFIGKTLLETTPLAPGTVYASIGDGIESNGGTETYLIRSADGGATWETVNRLDYARYQGWFSHFVALSPHTPNFLYTAGIETWKSNNGGFSLVQSSLYDDGLPMNPPIGGPEGDAQYVHPDIHHFAWHPADPDIFYLATDGGIFRTSDRGTTWEGLNGGLQTAQFYNGTAHAPTDSSLALGGLQDNNTVRYRGTGRWRRGLGGDGAWAAITPGNPSRSYNSAQYLNLWRSDDGFLSSFSPAQPPWPGSVETAFIAPYVIPPTAPNTIYAGRSVIYKSEDAGDSWYSPDNGAPLDGNPPLSMAVSPTDAGVVYVGTAPFLRMPVDSPAPPGVFVTRNGGFSWQNITAGLPDRFPTDLAVHPTDPGTAYVTLGGWGTPHLYKTTDFGATWTSAAAGLPDVPGMAVTVSPFDAQQVFYGDDVGVWVSDDGAASWRPFVDGLPEAVHVLDLAVSEQNRALRVATHGNGMYQRALPTAVSVSEGADAAAFGFALAGPNPVASRTALRFALERPASVRIIAYDALGREVAVLMDEARAAGPHRVAVDAGAWAPGVYVVVLQAGMQRATQSITKL